MDTPPPGYKRGFYPGNRQRLYRPGYNDAQIKVMMEAGPSPGIKK
jgi:saccharopine dehydrogenase-like NADP-dependent oxidoreductase